LALNRLEHDRRKRLIPQAIEGIFQDSLQNNFIVGGAFSTGHKQGKMLQKVIEIVLNPPLFNG